MNRERAKIVIDNFLELLKVTSEYNNDYVMTEDEMSNIILRDLAYKYPDEALRFFNPFDVQHIKEKFFFLESDSDVMNELLKEYILCSIDFNESQKYEMSMKNVRMRVLNQMSLCLVRGA